MPSSAPPAARPSYTLKTHPLFRKRPVEHAWLYLLGMLARLRPTIRAAWPGLRASDTGGRHVVYVHYDPEGRLHRYVRHQVQVFADLGYAVTFVSNAPSLGEADRQFLLERTRLVMLRRNAGYDFAAYRDGLHSIPDWTEAQQVILSNDSVYGPFFPLEDTLRRCDPEVFDIWGVCDSASQTHHIQSFFVLFYPRALHSPVLQRFWRWYPDVSDREWAVLHGEHRFSRLMLKGGLRIGAVHSIRDAPQRFARIILELEARRGEEEVEFFLSFIRGVEPEAINPTQMYFELMFRRESFPYLKRSLITRNPIFVVWETDWKELIGRHSTEHLAMMVEHLDYLAARAEPDKYA